MPSPLEDRSQKEQPLGPPRPRTPPRDNRSKAELSRSPPAQSLLRLAASMEGRASPLALRPRPQSPMRSAEIPALWPRPQIPLRDAEIQANKPLLESPLLRDTDAPTIAPSSSSDSADFRLRPRKKGSGRGIQRPKYSVTSGEDSTVGNKEGSFKVGSRAESTPEDTGDGSAPPSVPGNDRVPSRGAARTMEYGPSRRRQGNSKTPEKRPWDGDGYGDSGMSNGRDGAGPETVSGTPGSLPSESTGATKTSLGDKYPDAPGGSDRVRRDVTPGTSPARRQRPLSRGEFRHDSPGRFHVTVGSKGRRRSKIKMPEVFSPDTEIDIALETSTQPPPKKQEGKQKMRRNGATFPGNDSNADANANADAGSEVHLSEMKTKPKKATKATATATTTSIRVGVAASKMAVREKSAVLVAKRDSKPSHPVSDDGEDDDADADDDDDDRDGERKRMTAERLRQEWEGVRTFDSSDNTGGENIVEKVGVPLLRQPSWFAMAHTSLASGPSGRNVFVSMTAIAVMLFSQHMCSVAGFSLLLLRLHQWRRGSYSSFAAVLWQRFLRSMTVHEQRC